MNEKHVNIEVIKTIAIALGELNEQLAFVGGAVISLYADDPASEEPRPTKDIDIVLEILSYTELVKIQDNLNRKGFNPDQDSKVICRFKYDEILVDVMSTQEIEWAPANLWFKDGFKHIQKYELEKGIIINILPLAYFLASKFEAFKDRGKDPRTSHDFEDIIYLLDNRINLVDDIIKSPEKVRTYLQNEFKLLIQPNMEETILCHLDPLIQAQRYQMLMGKLNAVINF